MSMLCAKDGALTGVTFGPLPTPDVCGASHDLDAHPSSHVQVIMYDCQQPMVKSRGIALPVVGL